jgi:hypothetical protein
VVDGKYWEATACFDSVQQAKPLFVDGLLMGNIELA